VWPKRKILFVIPHGCEGWQGILSLLKALHIEYVVRETSENISADLTDLASLGLEQELTDLTDVGPTEILYWPDIPMEDAYRKWGFSRGLMQVELSEFLRRYWEEEIILPVEQCVTAEYEPLLWKFLSTADFEPSLIWKSPEEQWVTRVGSGLHWIVPKTWYRAWDKVTSFGRKPKRILEESYWVLQDNRVHFYSDTKSFAFLGTLEPYKNKDHEQAVYDTVLQALQLGVPWKSIESVYAADFNSPRDDIVKMKTV
jgi:hypothetical protein